MVSLRHMVVCRCVDAVFAFMLLLTVVSVVLFRFLVMLIVARGRAKLEERTLTRLLIVLLHL